MTLFVVSTPIGNLEDITFRALRILREASVIACEDTRRTQKLLSYYSITKQLISYHAASPHRKVEELIDILKQGKIVALVSDSGTPGISDPGYIIIKRALDEKIPVQSIPGPTALAAACACSGLPSDKFVFLGFLPRRTKRASDMLARAGALNQTIIIYESPYRVHDTLALLHTVFGDCLQVVVARELTKKFEEVIRGSVQEVKDALASREIKGEVVILVRKNIAPSADAEGSAAL